MRWVLVLWLFGACYRPDPPEGAPCQSTEQCPTPQICDQGTCRRIALDASHTVDARVPIDAAPDARGPDAAPLSDAPMCPPALTTMFSAPVVNMQLSTPSFEGTPTLTGDRLEIFFKSSRPGGLGDSDLWTSRRLTSTAPWPAPTNIAELNTAAFEGSPEISADGLTMWFSSDRPGGVGGEDVWVTKRPTRTSPWGTPVLVPELSSTSTDEGVMVLPSQLVLYLHSDRDGLRAIFRSTRATTTSAWSTPVAVPGLPIASNENPWVTADECTMYFASKVGGGLGLSDLYTVHRTTTTGVFGPAVALTTLSSTAEDQDPVLSADQRSIMYVSDRNTATNYDFLEATR